MAYFVTANGCVRRAAVLPCWAAPCPSARSSSRTSARPKPGDPSRLLRQGDIFSGNLKRVALAFIHNHAPQIDHTIPHDNIRCRNWRPQFTLISATKRSQIFASSRLACGAPRAEPTMPCMMLAREMIPNNLMAAYYWHALDAMPLHQLHDIFERSIFANRLHFDRHHLRDLGGVRMRVFLGNSARPRQEFKPPQDVAVRYGSPGGGGNRLPTEYQQADPSH